MFTIAARYRMLTELKPSRSTASFKRQLKAFSAQMTQLIVHNRVTRCLSACLCVCVCVSVCVLTRVAHTAHRDL